MRKVSTTSCGSIAAIQHHVDEQSRNAQARAFLGALLHDDRGAYYAFSLKAPDGTWVPSARKIPAEDLRSVEVSLFDGNDVYVNVNGFIGRSRRSQRLRHVNEIMFDLDVVPAHSGETASLGYLKAAALELVSDAVSAGSLPDPTFTVDTGRGLQLHYIFQRSCSCKTVQGEPNKPLLGLVRGTRARISSILDGVLEPLSGKVVNDPAVSDLSRVCRVPGTLNTASGTWAALVGDMGPFWTLDGLRAYEYPKRKSMRSIRGAWSDSAGMAEALAHERMRAISALRDLRQSRGQLEGWRNELMFLFVNAAANFMPKDRLKAAATDFNSGLSVPLPESELNATVANLCRHTSPYRLTRASMARHAMLTEEESAAVGFFSLWSSRSMHRAMAKERTASKRKERDDRIAALAAQGLAQTKIAEAVGCSRRTVCSVLAALRPKGMGDRTAKVLRQAFANARARCLSEAARKLIGNLEIKAAFPGYVQESGNVHCVWAGGAPLRPGMPVCIFTLNTLLSLIPALRPTLGPPWPWLSGAGPSAP